MRRYRRQVDPHYVPLLSDWVEEHVWMQISRSGPCPDERTVGPEPNDATVEDYLRQRGRYAVDPAVRGTVNYGSPHVLFEKIKWE